MDTARLVLESQVPQRPGKKSTRSSGSGVPVDPTGPAAAAEGESASGAGLGEENEEKEKFGGAPWLGQIHRKYKASTCSGSNCASQDEDVHAAKVTASPS